MIFNQKTSGFAVCAYIDSIPNESMLLQFFHSEAPWVSINPMKKENYMKALAPVIRAITLTFVAGLLLASPLAKAKTPPKTPPVCSKFVCPCCMPKPHGPPKKILFFSKSSGYEHDMIKKKDGELSKAEQVLSELGARNNIQFTFTKDGSVFTPENIAKYDAFFFYTTGDLTEPGTDKNPPMSKEGKAAFLAAIANGKGFIGSHCASDTFHSPSYKAKGPAHYQ